MVESSGVTVERGGQSLGDVAVRVVQRSADA